MGAVHMTRKDEDDTAHRVPDLNFVRAQGRSDRLTWVIFRGVKLILASAF